MSASAQEVQVGQGGTPLSASALDAAGRFLADHDRVLRTKADVKIGNFVQMDGWLWPPDANAFLLLRNSVFTSTVGNVAFDSRCRCLPMACHRRSEQTLT